MTAEKQTKPEPVAYCAMCKIHYTREEWMKLPYVGLMRDEVESLELRNCVCSKPATTLAVSMDPQGNPLPLGA
jgi:hypothetical protein